MNASPKSFQDLLEEWRQGNREALDELTPWVYGELRRVAERHMQSERPDHTLQATALVNEAFLKLAHVEVPWKDRAHFFSLASTLMRRILVDHARGKRREKRGGGAAKIALEDLGTLADEQPDQLLELDEALIELAQLDPRKVRTVELHYFGGLTFVETAEALGVSDVTVHRDLKLARAWLKKRLSDNDG